MPSAERLARRSVALLARQGLPRGQAAEVIIHICDDAAHRLYLHDPTADTSWLASLRAEARRLWLREVHTVMLDKDTRANAVSQWADRVSVWARDFDRRYPDHRPPGA